MLGPCGDPKCPECGNSFGHGVPANEKLMFCCGNCKHVWIPQERFNKKVLYNGEVYYLREVTDSIAKLSESIDSKPTICTSTKDIRPLFYEVWK